MGGDGAGFRDVYTLNVGWYVDTPGGQRVEYKEVARLPELGPDPSTYPDPVVMHIPVETFADLDDDVLYFADIIIETAAFDTIYYVPTAFYLDRHPPGGSRLPPLENIPESLTLEELRTTWGGSIVGDVADYLDQQPGDILTFWGLIDGGSTPIEIKKVTVTSKDSHTKPEFLESDLEKLDPPGKYHLYYYAEDRHGNRNPIPSPETDITLWIKDSPVELDPPFFPAAGPDQDLTIYDPGVRPYLTVQIPTFDGVEAGMNIFLVFENLKLDGDVTFLLGEIDAGDIDEEYVLEADISYSDISKYFFPPDFVSEPTTYFLVQKGTLPLVPSQERSIRINIDMAGGPDPDPKPDPDPDPDKPDNPNDSLLAPLLTSDSGGLNVVPVKDNDQPATVTVYGLNKDGANALRAGDVVQAWLAGEAYGDEITVASNGVDVVIDVDPANPGTPAYRGAKWLYSTITRNVEGELIEAATPATAVVFQTADDLPGGGTLATSYFIAGARKGPGRYAINGTDVVNDNGTDIRCYVDDTGVTKDMTVDWVFQGLLTDKTPAPGGRLTGSFIVNDEDLRPRPDDPKEPGTNRAFRDVHVSRAVMEAIGAQGWAEFSYSITVPEGTSTSTLDEIYADIRIPSGASPKRG